MYVYIVCMYVNKINVYTYLQTKERLSRMLSCVVIQEVIGSLKDKAFFNSGKFRGMLKHDFRMDEF